MAEASALVCLILAYKALNTCHTLVTDQFSLYH